MDRFAELAGRRSVGMAPNPLTFSEIEAYERKRLVYISAWETGLIMRMDDAALNALQGTLAHPTETPSKAPAASSGIPITDTASVKGFLRGLMKAQATKKESK